MKNKPTITKEMAEILTCGGGIGLKPKSLDISQYWDCNVCGTKNNPDYDDCWWCNENKSKIERIVTQQRTELVEEIKKEVNILHDKKENELHGGYDDCDYLSAYETALEDVLQNINLLNKKNE